MAFDRPVLTSAKTLKHGRERMTDETPPGSARRWIVICTIAAWGVAFLGSFAAFYLTPARDFGLSAGWNRVSVYMGWQMAATGLAVVCLALAQWLPRGSGLRRLALVPAGATVLLAVTITALTIFASPARAPSDLPPDRPVTQPAPATN